MLNVKNVFLKLQQRVKLSHADRLTVVNWHLYLPTIVSTLFVFLIIYIITSSLFFFIDTTHANNSASYVSQSKPAANEVSNIQQWHLFGVALEANATALTTLPLKLLGVLVQTPINYSEAIISNNGEKEKIYHVGDALPGGATLYAVHADNVTIQYRGRLEKLQLNKLDQTPATNIQGTPNPTENNQYPNNLSSSPIVNEFIRNKMKDFGNAS